MAGTTWIQVIVYILLAFPCIVVLIDGFYRALYLLIGTFHPAKPVSKRSDDLNHKLLVLVVARDEEKVIGRTLAQIKSQLKTISSAGIVVLADQCSDQTAQIAMGLGVGVYLRKEGYPGKAEALSWFVSEARDLLFEHDIVIVFDADTHVGDGFFESYLSVFNSGVSVVQAYVNPKPADDFPLSLLVAYSEILSQKIDDVARSRLSWSVPLRGTGMGFRTDVFVEVCKGLSSQVDDIELSTRLADRNIPVLFCPDAVIIDPKASNFTGLAKQRGRWLKGQRQVWKKMQKTLWSMMLAGLSGWSLIHALLLKPKTALLCIKVILSTFILLLPFGDGFREFLLSVVLGSMFIDLAYYLLGLRHVDNALRYSISLLATPLFIILWVISWGFSVMPGQRWLRARE